MRIHGLMRVFVVAAVLGVMTRPCLAQSSIVADGLPPTWQQVDREPSFTLAVERQVFMPSDRAGRIVLAVQRGLTGPAVEELAADWRVTQKGQLVAQGSASLGRGMAVLTIDLTKLPLGVYEVAAALKHGQTEIATQRDTFEVKPNDVTPVAAGRVPLILPAGIVTGPDAKWPLNTGVPFPKGVLFDVDHVRVVDERGKPIPAQFTVRSRWGFEPGASIRWLGVDIQSPDAPAWWPDRQAQPYFLEFGPSVKPTVVDQKVTAQQTDAGYRIDTGPLQFTVKQRGFNLVDDVVLRGQRVMQSSSKHGLYLVDHQGSIYRAANDQAVKLSIEEQGDLRVVIRAEGWYVKDGSQGVTQNIALPTDKLCKFITRLEACAGQSHVRVLSTWVVTFDSQAVRLRDLGLSLPAAGVTEARFGVEDGEPIIAAIPPQGVTLLQDLPDRFQVQSGLGVAMTTGKRTDGNVLVVQDNQSVLGVSHRETWQRFPKQITVRGDELRFHIWPADGRDHPDIDAYSPDRFHQLWFLHQGKEMNLSVPWEMLFATMRISDNPKTGIYNPAGNAMGGVHANAMGIAITSDMLIQFQGAADLPRAERVAHAFQQRYHALADPSWLAASGAMGLIQPYDPERFPQYEQAAHKLLVGSWNTQEEMGEYGMFLYRLWHHGALQPDQKWDPYRLYSAGHHYEPYIPWLYYARSGDPFLLQNGMATIRQMSDQAIIHHADDRLVHREFHFRQRHLVGSTKHTNGMVAWGGDHAVFGHLTTYNGLMTAYYLTGDLRLREVVGQWHHTITQDRGNPELQGASRWGEGRDNSNSLAELIDLYQLTYDPSLLAYMGPALVRFRRGLRNWGLPFHKVLAFSRDPVILEELVRFAQEKDNRAGDQPSSRVNGFGQEGLVALASLYSGDAKLALRAMLMQPASSLLERAGQVHEQVPRAMAFCTIPDALLYLPGVMKGIAQNLQPELLSVEPVTQPLPVDKWVTRIILNETTDGPVALQFRGTFKQPAELQVFGPGNGLIHRQMIPEGQDFHLTLPADGVTGQYVLLASFKAEDHELVAPVSTLPGEVYVTQVWRQGGMARYFTRHGNLEDGTLSLRPHRAKGSILSQDLRIDHASTSRGQVLVAPMDEQGVWLFLDTQEASSSIRQPLILSVTPSRYFTPDEDKLTLRALPAETK